MKKLFLMLLSIAGTSLAMAQVGKQEDNQDELQQLPPRRTQVEVDRAARKEAQRENFDRVEKKKEEQAVKEQAAKKKVKVVGGKGKKI